MHKFSGKQWELVFVDDFYRYVNHENKILTTGFGSEDALKRNADIIRIDDSTIKIMRERYSRLFPK